MKTCVNYDKNKKECRNCSLENRMINLNIVVLELKSFYEAYKHLKSIHDKKELFTKEYGLTSKRTEKVLYVDPAYVVNACFCIELSFKYILIKNDISFLKGSRGHNLSYLFDLIQHQNKDTLKEDYKKLLEKLTVNTNQNEETLSMNIKCFAESYDKYRYLWDQCDAGYNYTLPLFVEQLYNLIIETNNEFKKVYPRHR